MSSPTEYQLDVLRTVANVANGGFDGCALAGPQVTAARKLEAAGLLVNIGAAAVDCDEFEADREYECWAPTDAGRALIGEEP